MENRRWNNVHTSQVKHKLILKVIKEIYFPFLIFVGGVPLTIKSYQSQFNYEMLLQQSVPRLQAVTTILVRIRLVTREM